jgi:HEPN domain-containing protein
MKLPDAEILQKVSQWLEFADEDLRLASHGLTLASDVPYRLIAYHAQQCAEKHLKAYLVYQGIDFPYTHNISRLLELCAEKADWVSGLTEAEELTPFAITTRYPGEDEKVTQEEATRAIEIAAKVRGIVREALSRMGVTLPPEFRE